MRVLSSLLIAVQAETWRMVEKDPTYDRKHAINKLATANALANRLAVFAKGGNPNNADEVETGLYDKVLMHNTKYFEKLERTLMDGDCGLMYKPKKNKDNLRRRRSTTRPSLALDHDDILNLCDDMEGEEGDECAFNEDGSLAGVDAGTGLDVRRRKAFDLDPEKFIKNARKVHTSIKKFTQVFLANCDNEEGTRNNKRLKRNMIMLSRRMRDGVRAGYCTVEEVADTKWKRLYPKIPKSGPDGKDGISWSEFFMRRATPKTRGNQDE